MEKELEEELRPDELESESGSDAGNQAFMTTPYNHLNSESENEESESEEKQEETSQETKKQPASTRLDNWLDR